MKTPSEEDWTPGHFQCAGQPTGVALYFPTRAALRGYEKAARTTMIRVDVTPAAKP